MTEETPVPALSQRTHRNRSATPIHFRDRSSRLEIVVRASQTADGCYSLRSPVPQAVSACVTPASRSMFDPDRPHYRKRTSSLALGCAKQYDHFVASIWASEYREPVHATDLKRLTRNRRDEPKRSFSRASIHRQPSVRDCLRRPQGGGLHAWYFAFYTLCMSPRHRFHDAYGDRRVPMSIVVHAHPTRPTACLLGVWSNSARLTPSAYTLSRLVHAARRGGPVRPVLRTSDRDLFPASCWRPITGSA